MSPLVLTMNAVAEPAAPAAAGDDEVVRQVDAAMECKDGQKGGHVIVVGRGAGSLETAAAMKEGLPKRAEAADSAEDAADTEAAPVAREMDRVA